MKNLLHITCKIALVIIALDKPWKVSIKELFKKYEFKRGVGINQCHKK